MANATTVTEKLHDLLQKTHCGYRFPEGFVHDLIPNLHPQRLSTYETWSKASETCVLHLFSVTVWNLCSAVPNSKFIHSLRCLFDTCMDDWLSSQTKTHSRQLLVLLGSVACSLAVLETRLWWTSGKRLRKKAARRTRALSPLQRQLMKRTGAIGSHEYAACIVHFLAKQFNAYLGDNNFEGRDIIYLLQHDECTYVGRCAGIRKTKSWAGGLLHRMLEHWRALRKHRNGNITKNQRRGRYYRMCDVRGFLCNCLHDYAGRLSLKTLSVSQPPVSLQLWLGPIAAAPTQAMA